MVEITAWEFRWERERGVLLVGVIFLFLDKKIRFLKKKNKIGLICG